MGVTIEDHEMRGDLTRHVATAWIIPGDETPPFWGVTWLPGRALTWGQAVTAMTLAEVVAYWGDDLKHYGRMRVHVGQWASELGLTGPEAAKRARIAPGAHIPSQSQSASKTPGK